MPKLGVTAKGGVAFTPNSAVASEVVVKFDRAMFHKWNLLLGTTHPGATRARVYVKPLCKDGRQRCAMGRLYATAA